MTELDGTHYVMIYIIFILVISLGIKSQERKFWKDNFYKLKNKKNKEND